VKRRAGLAALALVVAGCASVPPRSPADLAGRLALRVDGADAARSFSADFDLRGDAGRGSLRLTGPLGTTLGEARWQPGGAELQTGEGTRRFETLDGLAESLLGEALPLAALIEWLRGRAWPGAASQARADGFDQLGWTIDLARYATDGVLLARREQAPAVSVRVKLDRAS
jgi:outer membrane lipoprotein LolB